MFHPKMFSIIEGFQLTDDLRTLRLPEMVIDLWAVRSAAGASGEYLSLHPRFVIFFDDASIALGSSEHAKTDCSVCFVPAGLRLWGTVSRANSFQHLDIHVHRQRLESISDGTLNLRLPLFQKASAELMNLGMLLADECRSQRRPDGYAEALAEAAIHEIFHLAGSNTALEPKDQSFAAMIEHVRQNLREPISVESMGDLAGLSRSQFSKKFKDLTGKTPHRWLVEIRIEEAKKLLLSGKRFAEVAHATGFADQAHFNRCFRARTGMTPTAWLQRYEYPKGKMKIQD
ncbi:MAG: AraC family transcriptional regulator [Pseudomonadota bacterium]